MSSEQISDHRPARLLVAGSWIAVFVPVLSIGLLTAFLFVVIAAAARSRSLAWSAAGYTAVTVIAIVGLHVEPVFWIAIAILILGATGHLVWVRKRVVWAMTSTPAHRQPGAATDLPATLMVNDPAVQAALARRALREQARHLMSIDPSLATELAIGRPDLPRRFDDGGLVDINNVPESVLAQLPGVTTELATRIVSASRTCTLQSVEDLIVFAELPNGLAQNLREYVVFRERV
ncbi:MAG: hypothetical protein J2P18_20420 [Nocardia sp.]|nr:hypothetical protein [Nocardia sp.]